MVQLAQVGPRVGVIDDGVGGRARDQAGQAQVASGGPGPGGEGVVRAHARHGERPDLVGHAAVRPGVGSAQDHDARLGSRGAQLRVHARAADVPVPDGLSGRDATCSRDPEMTVSVGVSAVPLRGHLGQQRRVQPHAVLEGVDPRGDRRGAARSLLGVHRDATADRVNRRDHRGQHSDRNRLAVMPPVADQLGPTMHRPEGTTGCSPNQPTNALSDRVSAAQTPKSRYRA
jgi:hypothetical protein